MCKIRRFSFLAGGCASLLVVGASAGEWKVSESSGAVTFSFEQQGARYDGRFEEVDAMIDFDPNDPASGSIIGVVQMESINTRDYDRDAMLQDPGWFDTARYPEARFESRSIEKHGDGFLARGELTIKDLTNPAQLKFNWEPNKTGTRFLGSMTIDRFDYGLAEEYDSSFIGREVDVEVDLDLAQ